MEGIEPKRDISLWLRLETVPKGRYKEHESGQKGASQQTVELRNEHVRDFSDHLWKGKGRR